MRQFLYERLQGTLKEFYEDFIGMLKDFEYMLYGACKVSRKISQGTLKEFL